MMGERTVRQEALLYDFNFDDHVLADHLLRSVDAKHKLIVEQHDTNAAIDMGLLAATAGAARETLGVERIDAIADMGYKGEHIEVCEASGITPYVA